ncbi:hypothetical protein BME05_07310, partial [Klebsiella quasipneumoniae subsp. quasipneumoniae]
GTLWIAGPSMVGDFHPLISTGLPAHTVYINSIIMRGFSQYYVTCHSGSLVSCQPRVAQH